ncbi:MAG: DNA translocase FtsK 4TM domain-containing protein, partial [Tepidimonas sp.]|uniref:DNA translocase FtsK 4TM domain-containing protein n=1 Tax=Tepidimonas sp. TaxID=2002775 RepID=UPI004054B301
MSRSVNVLNADLAAPGRGWRRFAREIGLLLGAVALGFWLMAMLSHDAADPAWSTSGTGVGYRNWGGQVGAWVSDIGYYLFGASVWWLLAAAVRAWLAALARWLRAASTEPLPGSPAACWSASVWRAVAYGGALMGLMLASCVLEWSRLYRWDAWLPGHIAGGVLGELAGPVALRWLGDTGSALVALGVWTMAVAGVFRFSWAHVAERIGAAVDQWIESWRERREVVEDVRIGRRAARERGRQEVEAQAAHPPHEGAPPAVPPKA